MGPALGVREVGDFARDITDTARAEARSHDHGDLHRVVVEWCATARILADPELTAQLTQSYPDEDHGEVPAP